MERKILVIQTAFIGDAILTLPLIQILSRHYPQSSLDVVVVPRAAEIFVNHPAVSKIIQYDKRGGEKGLRRIWQLGKRLRRENYDIAIVPHRSLRSAVLTWLSRPKMSIGFDTSIGHWMFSEIVRYDPTAHEIERNLSLLNPLKLPEVPFELPRLYPSAIDVQYIDSTVKQNGLNRYKTFIAVAPGTLWNTKRWPSERYAAVCRMLASENTALILLGGKEDDELCRDIQRSAHSNHIVTLAGNLSLLQSAELIRRCKVLLSNDSAPMHIAVAMGTPVIAIFGATVPEFGFAPRGPRDVVIETAGLLCRPCSIHGGQTCPIKTFECMLSIPAEMVVSKMNKILEN